MEHSSNLNGPILNAYPDSMGGTLGDILALLDKPALKDVFQAFYILPSLFNTDLDRGFSIIDYSINETLAKPQELEKLKTMGIALKLDFVLNHLSVLSPQFQDILKKGNESGFKEFFIDWNQFWEGCGEMTEAGYILPNQKYIDKMFFRKPGLPLLMITLPDGSRTPYWNTFYQEIRYPRLDPAELVTNLSLQYAAAQRLFQRINDALAAGATPEDIDFGNEIHYRDEVVDWLHRHCRYLGQMDLNIRSPLVWEFYEQTLAQLAGYGGRIIRLDAFAYAPKEPGERNFLNIPETWEFLQRIKVLADKHSLTLLPEIHAEYAEGIHETLASLGYLTYDFFLPGLILHALESKKTIFLARWALEMVEKNIRTVNMLGCHDGIPLLDLKGLLPEEEIQAIIDVVLERGGKVKDLHGAKNMYYQVNATYYSALGEDDDKLLLARALQLFMPGRPQVWYLDLFAGRNDYAAIERTGAAGHKEINRTNMTKKDVETAMEREVVSRQLELLHFRSNFGAFGFDAAFNLERLGESGLLLCWEKEGHKASLWADLASSSYRVEATGPGGEIVFASPK